MDSIETGSTAGGGRVSCCVEAGTGVGRDSSFILGGRGARLVERVFEMRSTASGWGVGTNGLGSDSVAGAGWGAGGTSLGGVLGTLGIPKREMGGRIFFFEGRTVFLPDSPSIRERVSAGGGGVGAGVFSAEGELEAGAAVLGETECFFGRPVGDSLPVFELVALVGIVSVFFVVAF